MIQHFLAQLQLQAQAQDIIQPKNNEDAEVDAEVEEVTANDQKQRQQSNNQSQSTNQLKHLHTPFKLPMQYLPDDQLCTIDKSVLDDLELIECTKQTNNGNSNGAENTKPMYVHMFQPQSAFAKRHLCRTRSASLPQFPKTTPRIPPPTIPIPIMIALRPFGPESRPMPVSMTNSTTLTTPRWTC